MARVKLTTSYLPPTTDDSVTAKLEVRTSMPFCAVFSLSVFLSLSKHACLLEVYTLPVSLCLALSCSVSLDAFSSV